MTGEQALARFEVAAKAVKDNDPRADELISLCLPSDQNVLLERLRTSANRIFTQSHFYWRKQCPK